MSIPLPKAKSITPPDRGWHEAEIVAVEKVDVASPFDDPENPKDKIKITYELETLRDDGEPFEVGELYTLSAYEKSKLAQHVTQLGMDIKRITDIEDSLVGERCQVHIGHRETKKGGTWPQVLALAPSAKFTATKDDVPF